MSWFKRLFGKAEVSAKKETSTARKSLTEDAEALEQKPVISDDDPRIEEGQNQVLDYWRNIGSVDDDVIAYFVNPMFNGAPAWPNTRQAYRIIRTADSLIIASDGMSDPFVGTNKDDSSGFGLEAYIEISNAQDLSFDDVAKSAEFNLIEMVAQNVAGHGDIVGLLDRYGVLSMAVRVTRDFPEGWHGDDGQVGVLIGQSVPNRAGQIELPFGPCRFVAVTPIRPEELAEAAQSTQARNNLSQKRSLQPNGWRYDPEQR